MTMNPADYPSNWPDIARRVEAAGGQMSLPTLETIT